MRSVAAVSLALCFAALGCESAEKDAPEFPRPESEPPKALLGMIELPSGTEAPQLAAFVSTIDPKFGAMVPAKIAEYLGEGVESVASLDLSQPIRVFVADPKLATEGSIAVVVSKKGEVRGKDENVVRPITESVVAIGEAKVIAAIDNHAAYLVGQNVESSRAVAFPEHLVAAFSSQVGAIGVGRDFFAVVGTGTDSVVLAVEGAPKDPHVSLEIVARAGTPMAEWFALQSPSELSLHKRLPPLESADVFFDGTIHAGSLGNALIELTKRTFTHPRLGSASEASQAIAQFMDVATGDFAMIMRSESVTGWSMWTTASIYEVTDVAKAQRAYTALFSTLPGANPRGASSFHHAGVSVSRQIARQSCTAFFDGAAVYTKGEDDEARMRAAINRSRGRGRGFKLQPALDAAIARAKEDGASVVTMTDMSGAGVPAPPMLMSVIFGERSATLTFRFER